MAQPYVPVEGRTVPEDYHAFAQALAREVLSLRQQLGKPVPAHEKTTVTAWRDDGSIASFIKQKVAAYDPGTQFPHVAAQAWSRAVSALERDDVEASLRDYMGFVTGALGDGPAFTSRLQTLASEQDAAVFWTRADKWHGGKRELIRAQIASSTIDLARLDRMMKTALRDERRRDAWAAETARREQQEKFTNPAPRGILHSDTAS
jgi:hypothetical protein